MFTYLHIKHKLLLKIEMDQALLPWQSANAAPQTQATVRWITLERL